MNQAFKDGAERLDDPCFREGCKRRHVHKISAFRFHYVRVNEETGRAPLQADGLPEYQAHTGGDGLNLMEPIDPCLALATPPGRVLRIQTRWGRRLRETGPWQRSKGKEGDSLFCITDSPDVKFLYAPE